MNYKGVLIKITAVLEEQHKAKKPLMILIMDEHKIICLVNLEII